MRSERQPGAQPWSGIIGFCLMVLVSPAAGAAVETDRARAETEQAAPALEMVDLLVRAGRAFSAKSFASAARLYRLASTLDPGAGQPLVMAGVAAYQTNAPAAARRDLRRALRRDLSPEDRDLALTYLGLITDDLTPRTEAASSAAKDSTTRSGSLASSVGGGYDSNARQARRGVLDAETLSGPPATGAMFASASLEVGLLFILDPRTEVEIGLGFEQSIYPDRNLADLDSQDHALNLAVSHRLQPDLRLRLLASGDLSFSGAGTALRPFQSSFRLETQALLGGGVARLRLGGAWQATSTHDPTLVHLSGHRLEATATPTLSMEGWLASLGARVRRNALGTQRSGAAPDDDEACLGCTRTTVVSHDHSAVAALFLLSAPYRWPVRPNLWGRWELRIYDGASFTETQGGLTLQPREARLRRDEQIAFGSSLAIRLGQRITFNLRYEQSRFSSTLTPLGDAPPTPGVPQSRAFHKQALTSDVTIDWL